MTPTTTKLEPKLVSTEPPKKPRAEGQWTKKCTNSKSQPMPESPTAASRPARKPSKVQNPSPKHATSKSRPKESDSTVKDHRPRKDETKKYSTKKDDTKKDGTGKNEPTTKHSSTKTHPTTEPPIDESQPAKKASDVEDQSTTKAATSKTKPTETSQIGLIIIRIPWDGSRMRPVPIRLSQDPPLGITDARTKELEAWLGHVPEIWSYFNYESSFCWKHRKLLAILTHTDLRTVSQQVFDTRVTPDNFMYTCFKEQGLGEDWNRTLFEICGKVVYGDAFVFRWRPQQWGPDGRARLINTEEDFVEGAYKDKFPAKLLRTFFEPGEGLGTKL